MIKGKDLAKAGLFGALLGPIFSVLAMPKAEEIEQRVCMTCGGNELSQRDKKTLVFLLIPLLLLLVFLLTFFLTR